MIASVIEHLGRRPLELAVRRHERAEADAHRDAAQHELEDVPAAVGLGEVGRQPVGPAIGILEQVDRRVDVVGVAHPCAILLPFVAVHLRRA